MKQTALSHAVKGRLWLIFCLAFVFCRLPTFDFVNIDDSIHTYRNPNLNPPTFSGLRTLWEAPYRKLYIPLTYTVWAGIAQIAQTKSASTPVTQGALKPEKGENTISFSPVWFHGMNLFLHSLCALFVVYPLLLLLFKDNTAAIFGSLIFAIHPVQVEPVSWISGLKDVLSGFLSLISVFYYLKFVESRRRAYYVFSVALFILALLSKPSAVMVPFLGGVLAYFFFNRSFKSLAREVGSWLFFIVPFVLVTSRIQASELEFFAPPWIKRPLVALDALGFYFYKLLWPASLFLDYGRVTQKILEFPPSYFVGLALGFFGLIWLIRFGKDSLTWLKAGLSFLLLSLVPVLGFTPFVFQNISTTSDRYLYTGIFGVAVVFAGAYLYLKNKFREVSTRRVFALVIALLCIRASEQTLVWRNSIVLFNHAVKRNPESWISHNNLAVAYEGIGDLERAVHHYSRAAAIREDPTILNNLGAVYLARGEHRQALEVFQRAERLRPNEPLLMNNIGTAWMALGDSKKAREAFLASQRADPGLAEPRINLRKLRK